MKKLTICLDCGDTIVDEDSQVFAENGDVLSAEPITGSVEAIHALKDAGYRLALVADGRVASFENILKPLGLWDLFDARIISEALGTHKPDARMFTGAMEALGLTDADAPRMVMIGNNLERDIVGANRMGMISVLLSYSPRYRMAPKTEDEVPNHTTAWPSEWPALVDQIERSL